LFTLEAWWDLSQGYASFAYPWLRSLHRSAVAELESNIVSGNIVALYDKHNLSAKLSGGFGVVRPPSCAAGSAAAGISWDAGSVSH